MKIICLASHFSVKLRQKLRVEKKFCKQDIDLWTDGRSSYENTESQTENRP